MDNYVQPRSREEIDGATAAAQAEARLAGTAGPRPSDLTAQETWRLGEIVVGLAGASDGYSGTLFSSLCRYIEELLAERANTRSGLREDHAVCTFCQRRDHTGTAASYHPDTRFPSCGQPGCGIDYQEEDAQ